MTSPSASPAPIQYPVPWRLVAGLTPHLRAGTRTNVDDFTRQVVAQMPLPPDVQGAEHLPTSPRFLLVANHYQRKGLWILHTAAALTQAVRQHYGPGDPPVRWVVTANWPPWRIGPWSFASPGDRLLPRVAHALHCYPIPFAGADPKRTAQSIRRILQEAPTLNRPIGLFPEGVAGTAGALTPALPGIDRLLVQLAKRGLPVVPCAVAEAPGLALRFGPPVTAERLLAERAAGMDVAALVMNEITTLLPATCR